MAPNPVEIAPPENGGLMERILDLEETMFLAVKPESPAPCQQDPATFRIMRRAQFSAWPQDALKSYCHDLTEAVKDGRNLMTLKYARMDDRIPALNTNPLISEIAAIQIKWQYALARRYPGLIARGRPIEEAAGSVSFKKYLTGELETYSDQTLACLGRHIRKLDADGENMAARIYQNMVTALGYASLEEAEEAAQTALKK